MPVRNACGELILSGNPVMRATRLVGRERELAGLAQALAAPPAVVVVEGEAGIGKSRLLQEFLASPAAADHTMLVACCPPFRQPHTLGPVADALRQTAGGVRGLKLSALAGTLRPLFPEWAPDLPPAPEPAEDASAARHRLLGALAELLRCLGVDVLVIEDAHWADDATLEFLLFLAAQQPQRVSLVLTCRPDEVAADSPLRLLSSRAAPGTIRQRIVIGPLSVTETSGLMSSMLDDEPISAQFAEFVHDRTDGVPLAVEESVRLMGDRSDLTCREGSWVRRRLSEIAVPPSIRDAVLERVQRLAPDVQAVLRAAAVLTDPAPEAVLLTVTGVTADPAGRAPVLAGTVPGLAAPGWTALSDALATGLLQEDGRGLVSFRHMLACRAVLEAMPAPERRGLHLRAGIALEALSPQPIAELARHFREAGDNARWCRFAEQFADLALISGDEATACTLLHDLVTRAGLSAGPLARLAGKIPLTTFTGPGRHQGVIDALQSALRAPSLTAAEEAGLRFQLGMVFNAIDAYEQARDEVGLAVPYLAPDSCEAAKAMMLLGWPRGGASPATDHLRWLARADEVTARLAPADRLRFLVDRATVLLLLGHDSGWTVAARLPDDASTAADRRQITRLSLNLGDQAMRWGRYAEAGRRLAKGLGMASSHGYQPLRYQVLVTQAHLDWFMGSWEGLSGRVGSLVANEEISPVARAEAVLVEGLLHAAGGAVAGAGDCFQRVSEEVRRHGAVECWMEPDAGLARLRLAEGDAAEALELTGESINIVTGKGIWSWATDLAPARLDALAALGRLDEAAELVTAFGRGLRGCGAPAPAAALIYCQAIMAQARGEHADAAGLFTRAAGAWRALARPYEALLARERQAHCLRSCDRVDDAAAAAHEAFRGLSQLGARGDATRTARLLHELGADVKSPARGRPSYGNQLSPRELEVVRLLVSGRTNRQIADVLVVSVQTVASHLHSAMRKLQVSSRTALAVSAVKQGLVPSATEPGQSRS